MFMEVRGVLRSQINELASYAEFKVRVLRVNKVALFLPR